MLINQINEYISSYQKFLSPLTLEELGALTHISISIFILLCLISLISVFYSDILIKYFKLEEKYTWIAKAIKIRRQFQQYYFLLNTILIVVALFAIIYINLIVLLHW